jgi:hypothetical protein
MRANSDRAWIRATGEGSDPAICSFLFAIRLPLC